MALIQLHWKYKDGKTDIKAQADIKNNKDWMEFCKDTIKSFPELPDGAEWLAVTEKSPIFAMMEAGG